MPDLDSLGLEIKAHWQRYRPKLCAELEREGTLDDAVANAADLTADALTRLIDQGMPHDHAWELVREEWAFVPEKE